MTIPTTAMPIIHDLDVIRVDVRMSALEPGLRKLVEKLTEELHEARAHLYNARQYRDEYLDELEEIRSLLGAGPGVTALEAVKLAQKEIAKERAEANRCFAEHEAMRRARDAVKRDLSAAVDTIGAIGEALSCGLGEAVLDAAARVVCERDEARRHLLAIDDALDTQVGPNAETTLQAVERVRQERDNARADLLVARNLDSTVRGILGIRDGVSLTETVRRLMEERADDRSEYSDIRLELFANREESAIDAARRVVAENNELSERLRVVTKERDEARAFRTGVCAILETESDADAFAIVRMMASFFEALPALIEATNAAFAAIEPAVRK